MPTAHYILKADLDIESLENISELREEEGEKLRTEARIKNKNRLENGIEIIEATLLRENLVELTSLSLSNEEYTTEEDHVLRLDEKDSLSLVENRNGGGASISSDKEVAVDTFDITVIDWEFMLIEKNVNNISILEDIVEGELHRCSLDVESLIRDLESFGLLDATQSRSYENIGENTTKANIHGDVDNSIPENDFISQGDLRWIMTRITYKEQKIKFGFRQDGLLVVYGPMNLPSSAVASFIKEWVAKHLH